MIINVIFIKSKLNEINKLTNFVSISKIEDIKTYP
jgi:hypothetical protein